MKHKLLVVEYDRVTAETLKVIFEQEGYEVRTSLSPDEGLATAADWTPNILIAAMILGRLDGVQLAKRVVELCPKCRVILFAAQVSDEMIGTARTLGFDFYDKPVYPQVLIDRVRVLLGAPG